MCQYLPVICAIRLFIVKNAGVLNERADIYDKSCYFCLVLTEDVCPGI